MITGILGKKVGMTQLFDAKGNCVGVTVLQAGPCTVLQKKTPDMVLILSGDHEAIIDYSKLGRSARLSVPTLDHYLPLLYVLGAQDSGDGVNFLTDKVTLGSMSMRSVRLG